MAKKKRENDGLAKYRKKNGMRYILWLVWGLLIALVIFFVVRVVLILQPNIRTELAVLETMKDSITARGFVALESTPVHTSGGGVLYYTLESGERVSAGTQVAELYANESGADARVRLDEVTKQIEQLETAQRTSTYNSDTEQYTRNLQNSLYSLMDAVDGGDYTAVSEPLDETAYHFNKLQIATGEANDFTIYSNYLNGLRDSYSASAVPTSYVTSDTTGFFVASSGKDRIPLSYDTLSAATPATLDAMLGQTPEYYGESVAGYVISDYKWQFFALVTAQEAQRFTEGDKSLTLTFSGMSGNQLPVRVDAIEIDEAAGIAKIELHCEYMSSEILKMQNETVEIVFSTHEGIRLSKDTLRVIDGVWGVYTLYGNNVVYFKTLDILIETDQYLLVQPGQPNTEQLRLYDNIITDSGGTELYDGKIL